MRKYKNTKGQTALEIASEVHTSVNQTYNGYPYSLHLEFVCGTIERYFEKSSQWKGDNLLFNILYASGAYHDLIEDCRITYNDLLQEKRFRLISTTEIQDIITTSFMREEKREEIVDIVYACTELRGRNRDERHGYEYYKLLFSTPYAWFVKTCDIIANSRFSKMTNHGMLDKYKEEVPCFVRNIYGTCRKHDDFDETLFIKMKHELEEIIEEEIEL